MSPRDAETDDELRARIRRACPFADVGTLADLDYHVSAAIYEHAPLAVSTEMAKVELALSWMGDGRLTRAVAIEWLRMDKPRGRGLLARLVWAWRLLREVAE